MIEEIILKIKRKEGKLAAKLYNLAWYLMRCSFPCIRSVHLPLYYLREGIIRVTRFIKAYFWDVPLFSARCEKAGRGLRLPNGIPLVIGNLKIYLGSNVTIYRTTLGASKVYDKPQLKIGNNSSIGYGAVLSIAKEVIIGDDVLIAPNCLIMDNDDHPIDPVARRKRQMVNKKDVAPVIIGDNVWIGNGSIILKGVNIGRNTIISAGSVVTKNIPENCIAAGYPARPVIRDITLFVKSKTKELKNTL